MCKCVCVFVLLQRNVFIIQAVSAVNQLVSQRNYGNLAFTNGRLLRTEALPSGNKSVCAQQGRKQATHSSNHWHVCMYMLSPLSPVEQQQLQWGSETYVVFIHHSGWPYNHSHTEPVLLLLPRGISRCAKFPPQCILKYLTVLQRLISIFLKKKTNRC